MKLVSFLYLLGRDHLPIGVINALLEKASLDDETKFSDELLEQHARATAKNLTKTPRPTAAQEEL